MLLALMGKKIFIIYAQILYLSEPMTKHIFSTAQVVLVAVFSKALILWLLVCFLLFLPVAPMV